MSRVRPEYWEQVKEVFEAARDRQDEDRAEFLDRACAGDAALRVEVESLIRSYEEAGSFMESPAVSSAAESLVGEQKRLEPGDRIGHYEIVEPIGAGGMGEVYLAKDTVLGRRVAIKLLPEYLSHDRERLRRFKQEARTASTLNHPNVCVIHEVSETDEGCPFIAMEFVEGLTLRQRVSEGAMSLGEALDIAIQVADALTAAHEAGIVHRDVKPENIMIRRDGYVKVLDFGLAKLTERSKAEVGNTLSTLLFNSTPGMVMGTVGYMSPEQARGVAVDLRTDIWSLSVTLYEMVAGEAPFKGATPTDVVIAIVEKEQPALGQYLSSVPAELERIVRKGLRKDPEERYQLMKELNIDLRSLRKDLEIESNLDRSIAPGLTSAARRPSDTTSGLSSEQTGGTSKFAALRATNYTPLTKARSPWLRLLSYGLGAAFVLALGLYAVQRFSGRNEKSVARFQRINVTKLTTNGKAVVAAISPDGKYVAYSIVEGGKQSIWLRQVAIASNIQLAVPMEGQYFGLRFSPDGNFLYYGYAPPGSNNADIFKIPVLGNSPAMRETATQGPPTGSHDGKKIAFIRYDHEQQRDLLVLANADGSNEQIFTTRIWPLRLGWDWDTSPAWSPDDRLLVLPVVNTASTGFYITILEIDLTSHAERIVPLSKQMFEQPGHVGLQPDASGVLMSAKAEGASFDQIWQLPRDGSARSITNDLSDYRELNLTSRGDALVTVQTQTLSNIWTLTRGQNRAAPITSGAGRYFDITWAPDGKVIYASDASGMADIYEIGGDGTAVRQLTSSAGRNYAPDVSPDGRYIVMHSNRSGVFQIWRIDRDGSNPKQLTFGDSECNWPAFSADGNWVVYQHFEANEPTTLWKVGIEGGTPVKVSQGSAIRPVVSPDGNWIACWRNNDKGNSRWGLAIIPIAGGAPSKTFDVAASVQVRWDTLVRWSFDGRSLTYVDHTGGVDNIWSQPLAGGPPVRLTEFKDSTIFSFDWAHDGALVASRGVQTSDVVLIRDATP